MAAIIKRFLTIRQFKNEKICNFNFEKIEKTTEIDTHGWHL
jgi:hypothetical protein